MTIVRGYSQLCSMYTSHGYTIRGRRSSRSELPILWLLFEGGDYMMAVSIPVYRAAICPRILWDMGVSDLPISWIKFGLKAIATRYLKRSSSGLACSADPSLLYLPKPKGGLDLSSISGLYQKIHVSHACQLLTSQDPITQHVHS